MKKLLAAIGRFMKRPVAIGGAGVFTIVGIAIGVVGYIGFHTALKMSTSTEFCISCHTMRDNNFEEDKTTIHYKNPVGVRAECSDCHVPKAGWPLYKAKIMVARDVWGELTGSIDTREKFESERLRLAKIVWAEMEANDSAQCRSCHSFESMDFEHQKPNAAKMMKKAMTEGDTCIDCHKGIAHHLPDMSSGYKSMFKDIVAKAPDNRGADTLYAMNTTELYDKKPADDSARAAGNILPLTKVHVEERDGDWMKVTIKGWMQEGMERVLVKEMGAACSWPP